MTTETILIESNSVHREAMKRMLIDGGYKVVACVQSVDLIEDWDTLPRNAKVVLSGNFDGSRVQDIARIKTNLEQAVIVILGGKADLQSTFSALKAGAHAYLDDTTSGEAFLKSLAVADLDRAVISIRRDSGEASAEMAADEPFTHRMAAAPAPAAKLPASQPAAPGAPSASLSPREAAILNLLREGAPNKLIALRLCMTESTVKVHLKAILRKIRVKNRTQAAVWAMENEKKPAPATGNAANGHPLKGHHANGSAGGTIALHQLDASRRHDH